jgi:hypothetical protein
MAVGRFKAAERMINQEFYKNSDLSDFKALPA